MKTIKDRHYSFIHTQQRLNERYNMAITLKDYDRMCSMIKDKKYIFLIEEEYQHDDVQQIYDLDFPYKNPIRVVWSTKREWITTVLKRK
jgi:hypothetical protein